jgi:hypothetical protein
MANRKIEVHHRRHILEERATIHRRHLVHWRCHGIGERLHRLIL